MIRNTNSTLFDENLVVNIVELLAYEKISEIMKQMDVCDCMQCTADVLAMALNSLPPKYATSDSGKQYAQLKFFKQQFETDVASALVKACLIVKKSPKHNDIDA